MPRMISCAMTPDAVRELRKTVTRRTRWKDLKVGTLLWVVEKGQGIPKGGHVNRLALVLVTDVRREDIRHLEMFPEYGREEMVKEGLPDLSPWEFVALWGKANCYGPVTRIEWEYVAPWILNPGGHLCAIHGDDVTRCEPP